MCSGSVWDHHPGDFSRTSKLLVGEAVDEIGASADSQRANLIAVGSRGRGALGSVVFGSASRGLLQELKAQVAIIRAVAAVAAVPWGALSSAPSPDHRSPHVVPTRLALLDQTNQGVDHEQ